MQWAIPGVLVLVLVAALTPDPSGPDHAAETTGQRSEDSTDTPAQEAQARAAQAEADRRRAATARREQVRVRARRARARRARAARRRAEAALAAEQERLAEERERLEQEEERQQQERCHPSYDPCLDPNASDYDCENGSGDGPEYTGLVTVKGGSDPYDLDRDGDGTGCDS